MLNFTERTHKQSLFVDVYNGLKIQIIFSISLILATVELNADIAEAPTSPFLSLTFLTRTLAASKLRSNPEKCQFGKKCEQDCTC